ncbi:hypothetical protein [Streptomyces sp. NPDC088727]|uniref:hypothetical protein n=1 Tax=Streptomyces sp. NPDC088727 TaxID=3365875 RepID=UPI00380B18EC
MAVTYVSLSRIPLVLAAWAQDVHAALAEMHRVLWPGGLLLVSTRPYDELLREYPASTQRHAGHTDIVRELVDGTTGLRAGSDNMASGDAAWWAGHRDRVERAARQAPDAPPA